MLRQDTDCAAALPMACWLAVQGHSLPTAHPHALLAMSGRCAPLQAEMAL